MVAPAWTDRTTRPCFTRCEVEHSPDLAFRACLYLQDIPALLNEATPAERQQMISQLLTQVYGKRSGLVALRPTRIAAPLFVAAAQSQAWLLTKGRAGGPGGARTHDHRLKRPLLYH